MAGVVGHPVSEKGNWAKPGWKPFNGIKRECRSGKTELACFLERETALVNWVVSDGFNRYHE